MTLTTQVPQPSYDDTGITLPTAQEVLAGVLADWQAAFAERGLTLSTELTTPQGQLASSQAYLVHLLQTLLAELASLVDPLTTYGAYQDALGRIYNLERSAATRATVDVQAVCSPWVTIPAGVQARSETDGTLWETTSSTSTGAGGTITITFKAITAGAGPAVGVNALKLTGSTAGLQSITNSSASTAGTAEETRASFEYRRQNSVAIGGSGTAAAVRAAVANLADVTDCYVVNNPQQTQQTFGATSYPVPAHSVAIVVAGGDATDIADTILGKLDAGCGFATQNATSMTVYDTAGYQEPYPSYTVRFVRPTATPVYFKLEVAETDSLPADYTAHARAAIVSMFEGGYSSGSTLLDKARIGAYLVAADYLVPLRAISGMRPVSLEASLDGSTYAGIIELGIDQLPTIATTDIAITLVTP
jgi:hypothetical protein